MTDHGSSGITRYRIKDTETSTARLVDKYKQSNSFVFLLFLVYVVFWYLQGGVRWPALGAIRFEFLLGALLSVLALPAYLSNTNRQRCGVGVWVAFLFGIMAVMVVFSYVPEISYLTFVDRVLKFALLGGFIAAFVTTPTRLGLFIGAFLFACIKMGQEGVVGTITGSLIWENQGIPRLHGATPNYAHPNSFSGMALGSVPFVIYFYRIVPRYLRLVLLVQLAFALNIILFTGSRTGYVALLVGLGFLVWKSSNRKRAFFFLLCGAIAVAPFIPETYLTRAESIFTQKEKEGQSTEARKEILEDAIQIFLENPLGVGVSAFPAIRKATFGRAQDTHNLYLEVATNLGILGLFAFGGFISALFGALVRLDGSIGRQIRLAEQALGSAVETSSRIAPNSLREHLRDLAIMRATSKALYLFLIIRLGLGLFGMDLYEVYWWFASGTTVAVWNINVVAQRRTVYLYNTTPIRIGTEKNPVT